MLSTDFLNIRRRYPMNKVFINAQQLLEDSFNVAIKVYESGYQPNFIVGVWRGGAPVGIAVQEVMDVLGVNADHIAIRTSSYTGMAERSKQVNVHGLNYLIKRLCHDDRLLIVDDVYDTGLSIQQIIADLNHSCKRNMPEVRIATPYFKPNNNRTERNPDFFIHKTNDWLVFPHELDGLSLEEIAEHKPELLKVANKLRRLAR